MEVKPLKRITMANDSINRQVIDIKARRLSNKFGQSQRKIELFVKLTSDTFGLDSYLH